MIEQVTKKRDDDKPYLGYAVDRASRRIRHLSVSAIRRFDPRVDGGCNRKWAGEALGFWQKEPSTPAQERGGEAAKLLEHYLKTGAAVLPPYLLAGVKFLPQPGADLEIEQQLGGGRGMDGKWPIEKAVALRDASFQIEDAPGRLKIEAEVARLAGLVACGIPISGAFDYGHRRGVYIDGLGVQQREDYPQTTMEIGDHKTSSDIGQWSLSPDDLPTDVQMVGYGVNAHNRHLDLTHVRLSHNNYQTKGKARASKTTALVEVGRLVRTWQDRVEPVVRGMIDVAKIKDPKEAEPNLDACSAFNRDCPHRAYCPLTAEQLLIDLGGKGDPSMSLFNKYVDGSTAPPLPPPLPSTSPPVLPSHEAGPPPLPSSNPPTLPLLHEVSPPPLPSSNPPALPGDRQARVEAEKARLLAEDAGQPPLLPSPLPAPHLSGGQIVFTTGMGERIPVTACNVGETYYVDCEDGRPPVSMKHTGTSRPSTGPGVYLFLAEDGSQASLEAKDDVWEIPIVQKMPHVGSILPPDAARHNALNFADPLAPEHVAIIADPGARAAAVELAARHADHKAAEDARRAQESLAASGGKTSGRCPAGKSKVALSLDQLAARRVVCACGKVFEGSKVKPSKEGEHYVWELPGHNLPVVSTTAPPVLPAAVPLSAPARL